MDPSTEQAPQPEQAKMTKEERSKIMSEAAKRRWAKARKAKAAAAKPQPAPKPPASKKKPSAPREFSSALKTAEKRLAQAILERSKAAATYAVLSAEIPSLQRLIIALRNPLGVLPEYGVRSEPSLEQIVGDQPLQYQNPPRVAYMPSPDVPVVPQIPVPQTLHPANQQTRGGGSAVGVDLAEEDVADEDDENKFLNESALAGGSWR